MTGSRDDGDRQSGLDARAVSSVSSKSPRSPNCNDRNAKHQNVSTPTENNKTTNAFDMIMSGGKNSSSKKRRRNNNHIAGSHNKQPSRFVPCPVGCGKHILPHEMNKHLDACLLRQATKQQQEKHNTSASTLRSVDKNEPEQLFDQNEESSPSIASTPIDGTPPESVPPTTSTTSSPVKTAKETDQAMQKDQRDQSECTMNTTTENRSNHKQNNVFAHMMERSVKVFSEQEACSASLPKLFQRMHLHENGTVSLICYRNNRTIPPEDKIAWSAIIQVRGKKEGATAPPIDLLVSSSVPASSTSVFSSPPNEPQHQRPRLVGNHSRLSVPVLKSILQKGIRRRKPLPSVRVASELADKSLGDLLRRLPIILLEDSTLHPSIPFLVWLMMAVSKDYQPPLSLLKRVLGIVFEMASCRWQDSLRLHNKRQPTSTSDDNNESNIDMEELQRQFLTLSSLHKPKGANRKSEDNDQREEQPRTEVVLNDDELMVWSILMRGQYGGMAGDIRMLQGYAEMWHERFTSSRRLSDDMKKRLSPSIHASSNSNSSTAQHESPSTTSSSTASFGGVAGHESLEEEKEQQQHLEEWNQVPAFIHKSAAKHSACRIDRLVITKPTVPPSQSQSQPQSSMQNNNKNHHRLRVVEDHSVFVGLPSLCRSDITLEGVDFHCSSVLESAILSDAKLVRVCLEKLGAGTDTDTDGRSWLEGKLKSCMWKYSGGVNFRLPLISTETNDNNDDDDDDLKRFYETFIRPRVEAFSERYIDERLNKRR
jgi:hypothetical protein